MTETAAAPRHDAARGITFILIGMLCISVNDMLIKWLSTNYPLHQMVFARSVIGLAVSFTILHFEGGLAALRTGRPGLHLLRGLLVVGANMAFFTALAVMPLASATALFFVAPLFITALSVPFLGERVGPRRWLAVIVGFLGVVVMLRPGFSAEAGGPGLWVMALPVLAAFGYACMQILTRRLGVSMPASAMAIWLQGSFLVVSLGFLAVAGDGRLAEGQTDESLRFLLRAWRWPEQGDMALFLVLGAIAGVMGYALSQAYRSADAATVAPFEYLNLAMAILLGWVVFGEVPGPTVLAGIALIAGSGLYVFLRERRQKRPVRGARPVRR